MASQVTAGRPGITLINAAGQATWLAIYKRPLSRGSEPPIAWQVMNLSPGERAGIFAPRTFQVCGRYSFEPDNPRRPIYQTNVLEVPHAPAGAGFTVDSVATPDRRNWGAVLRRVARAPGGCQISVVNRFPLGVWLHVRQDGRDVFPPRILPPRAVSTEDLRSPFYVAALLTRRAPGDRLLSSEIALTEVAVDLGESFSIQNNPVQGFKITKTL